MITVDINFKDYGVKGMRRGVRHKGSPLVNQHGSIGKALASAAEAEAKMAKVRERLMKRGTQKKFNG